MNSTTKPTFEHLEKQYESLKEKFRIQEEKLIKTKQDFSKASESLQMIERTAKIGYWEFFPKTLKQYWSDEIFRILEYDISEEAPDVPQGVDFIDEKFQPMALKAIEEAVQKGKSYAQEWIVKTNKGNKKWIYTVGEPEIVDGEVVKVSGSFQDITRDKLREQVISDNKQEFQTWIQNTPVCTKKIDVDFNLQFMSDAGIKELKVGDVNRLYGKPYPFYFFPKPTRKLLSDNMQEVKESLEMRQAEGILSDTQGNTMWYRHIMVPVLDMKGELDYILIISTDITKQKQTEHKLIQTKEKAEENKEKFRLLNKFSSEMLLMDDIESIYKFISDSVQTFCTNSISLIVSIDEISSTSKLEAVSGLNNKWLKKVMEITGSNPVGNRYSLPDIHKNYFKSGNFIEFKGSLSEFSSSEFPPFVAKALEKLLGLQTIYSIGINKDNILLAAVHLFPYKKEFQIDRDLIEVFITQAGLILEKKINEKQLKVALEKAEESDRLKTAFLSNMSHEIRTPMNGILGFTSLLEDKKLSVENQERYINIIKKSGDRLLSTVNDIIEISKIESGQIVASMSSVDVTAFLESLIDFFKPEASKKGIDIIFKNDLTDNNFNVLTDETKLNSIISNLIKNAIKFTNKGSITVRCSVKKQNIIISCKDSGIGIPKDRQIAIFNRFEQADIEDRLANEGSGLGLAIVKSYVEMLEGEIWVESEEGKGSTFYVRFPLYSANNATQEQSNMVKTTSPVINNVSVLIAEDDEISSLHLKTILNGHVKNIKTVSNGVDAVNACKNDPDINLILMDIKMPGLNGLDATRKIREFNKDVVIYAQTAYAFEEDKREAFDAGCNNYISKPIDSNLLIESIKRLNFKDSV